MPKKRFFGFRSGFASDLDAFIEYKKSLGFVENSYKCLNNFDEFCADHYPQTTELTVNIVTEWCMISNHGIRVRCIQIREFAKYLQFIGKSAYVYPMRSIPTIHRGVPYIISEPEQDFFYKAVDRYPHSWQSPLAGYTAPVIFRLMLSCGPRPLEVRNLRRVDFDFNHGTIYFEDSKNHRDRRIAIAWDLMDLCKRYDQIAESMFPGRVYFFPNRFGESLGHSSLEYLFQRCWDMSGNDIGKGRPSLYSFRFTFATETLMRWVEEGKDLDTMLPYLSAYMGHVCFQDTYYYIRLLPERIARMKFMDVEGIIPEVLIDEEE